MSGEKIRILMIDDDQGDFEMSRAMVSQIDEPGVEFSMDWVSTFEEGVDAFDRNAYDVYFVDYFLEDRDGLELVRRAREKGVREPLIMLTGRGSHRVDVEAMKAGASDYLVKGKIDPDVLERTIRYALERVRAEAALRDSEERHRSMFDHLPIGLYRVSPEGEFMDANPALVRILNYPDSSTLQNRYAASLYVNPGDRARFEGLLEQYGIARAFETVLERHDGTTVRVRNTARAHRGPEGEIQYMEGAVEDVTDARSAEELRGSAARFETVYVHSGLCILLVDLDGTVVEGNPAFRRVAGYGQDELRGKPVQELGAGPDAEGLEGDVRALARGEMEELTGERRLKAGDGTVLWARVRASLVRDSSEDPDHVMLILEDVAEG